MGRSRIFEEYARIATEQGLVSPIAKTAEEHSVGIEGHLKVDMGKTNYSTRQDYERDELSSSEILYGLKPKSEKHIMEEAHPNPVVLSPAYDKINGLVENNIERQNIIINQIGRPNNGQLTNKKLAEQNLVMELVRLANDLDLSGREQLRALADSCIEQLSVKKKSKINQTEGQLIVRADWIQSLRDMISKNVSEDVADTASDVAETGKGAAEGAVIGGVIGGVLGGVFGVGVGALPGIQVGALAGGVIGGLVSSLTKTGPTAVSVSINCDKLTSEIDDLMKTFKDEFLAKLRNSAQELKKSSQQYAAVLGESSTDGNSQHAESVTSQYISSMKMMKSLGHQFIAQSQAGKYKEDHSKVLSPVYWFMNTDEQDVQKALNSLMVTIESAEKGIQKVKEEYTKVSEKKPETKPVSNTPQASQTPSTPQPTKNPKDDESLFSLEPSNEPLINLK